MQDTQDFGSIRITRSDINKDLKPLIAKVEALANFSAFAEIEKLKIKIEAMQKEIDCLQAEVDMLKPEV